MGLQNELHAFRATPPVRVFGDADILLASVTMSRLPSNLQRGGERSGTCGARQQHCSYRDSRRWCSG
jgi:hypothetical protein